jgi:hypothetical protein
MIQTIEKYKFEGKEFDSLQKVKTHIENEIGTKIIDEITKVCPPQKFKDVPNILEVLTKKENRDLLLKYLNVEFEKKIPYANSFQDTESINIFDL